MKEPLWISRAAVEAIHDALVNAFGGIPGIRSENFLRAAIARPKHLYIKGEDDLCLLAAAYALGVARNTPFLDGNKRTAFMTSYVFLRTNGKELVVENAIAAEVTTDLAAGSIHEEEYAQWLYDHLELELEYA